jgi:hypothetical protein
MTMPTCPKCSATSFEVSNVHLDRTDAGLIHCANCGCVVGAVGGAARWDKVCADLGTIKNQLAAIRALVAVS